jgi:hypothetical protein
VLIILVAGTVEVGWFANNYLTLLEVTRVGARQGAILEGDASPLTWDLNPTLAGQSRYAAAQESRDCDRLADEVYGAEWSGYYNLISCLMLRSLRPLEFDPAAGSQRDDIVISAFSIALFPTNNPPGQTIPATVPRNTPLVVGRYPGSANECASDTRDPFDFYNLGSQDNGERLGLDAGTDGFRGYSHTGQHLVTGGGGCVGSEFTVADIQSRFTLPNFGVMGAEERRHLPNQGLVLVEMFWEHTLLLRFPFFAPLYNMLGERTVIGVWAAFPAPSVEPRVDFTCLPPNAPGRDTTCP